MSEEAPVARDAAHEQDGAPRPAAIVVEILPAARSTLAVIRFNRPGERNPLSVGTLDELDAALFTFDQQTNLSAIIFTGTGDVFASGANIREVAALTPERALGFARRGQQLMSRIAGSRHLTIATFSGYCMGGALDLALACRLRVASPSAIFAHPGARLGIITGWGGTQRLPRLVGAARALEIFATARRVNAVEAYEIGLVNRLDEDPLRAARELAEAFSSR